MSNRLALVVLAVACMAAAAGGGYLATRQNAVVPVPAAAQAAPAATSADAASTPATSAAPSDRPVQETEAVIGDAKPAPAVAPEPPKTVARRAQPPARTSASRSAAPASSSASTQPPTLTSTWPSSAQQTPPPTTTPEPPAAHIEDRAAQEPPRAPEPPKPSFEELVIARDSVIGIQTETRISSETAHVEDRVDARVSRDVKVGEHVAIPAGARALGTVVQVERGGKYREQAKLGIRFHTIVLADGTRLPITTDTIVRLGEAPGNSSAAKIGGGAVGGAILGAILGGAKGAAIGATAGAGAGTAAVQAGDRSAVVLQPGTPLTTRILQPVTVTVERQE